ncbi:MAG: hypothetical protein WDZ76_00410 [Pseudohongiellaceae bacterium]
MKTQLSAAVVFGSLLFLPGFLVVAPAAAQDAAACQDQLDCASSWVGLSGQERDTVFAFAEDYKAFIHRARTELSFVTEAIAFAEENGFTELSGNSRLAAGDRYYEVNRDRTISLMVIGERPMAEGFHIIGAHIDSPRLELKGRPVYQDGEFALFQTNYHGGIKYHQWTNLPLALIGRVDRKDGSVVDINLGLSPEDPIFMIAELSPHVDRGRGSRSLDEFIGPEDLDPIVGHLPDASGNGIEEQVFEFLRSNYDITPADLVSAELALVPAGHPRDMGFDRGLIAAYGQDDRLAAYTTMRALAEIDTPRQTAVAYLVDNEEVGNRNNTGAASSYFADLLSRLLYGELQDEYREFMLRQAMSHTRFVSIDVNPGVNPMNPGVWELGNAPRLGYGINIKLYGQGNNANSEFVAWTRHLLDGNNIPWQTSTYRVGSAGGGTIGGLFSEQNIEVIDFGVPLLSIHTPYAVSSKVDVHNLYRAALAFYSVRE